MKILKKFFLSVGILIFAFIIIFNQQIPAFIYNELEWRARADYLVSEQIRSDVDFLIGIRTGKEEVFISDQAKWNELMEEIEKGLDLVLELTENYSDLLHRQDKIPLLPAKYKKYQELKKPGFDNYQKGLLIFREVKDKEHKGFRLTQQLDIAHKKFTGLEEEISWEQQFRDITDAVEVAKQLNKQAEELYENKVIDEGFKDYIVLECNKMIDFYEVITDPKKMVDSEEVTKELKTIGQRGSEIDFNEIVTSWHKNILDDLNKEMKNYNDLAYEQMTEADKYYRENDLKNDLISKLLSKFSAGYPKNI